MAKDLVSIIIPCYNAVKYIGRAVESCCKQTYKYIEIIVVDDGSVDGSGDFIKKNYPDLKLITQVNKGVSAARNRGLKECSGNYVIFLDADDELLIDAVETHLEEYSRHPDASFIYGSNERVDADGNIISLNVRPDGRVSYSDVIYGGIPGPSQSVFKVSLLKDIGGFDEGINFGEDMDVLLKLSSVGDGWSYSRVISKYRMHPAQATKKPSLSLIAILDIVQNHKKISNKIGICNICVFIRWNVYFGQFIPIEFFKEIKKGAWCSAKSTFLTYMRTMPFGLWGTGKYLMKIVYSRFLNKK